MATLGADWLTPVFGSRATPSTSRSRRTWLVTALTARGHVARRRCSAWLLFRNGHRAGGAAGRPGRHRRPQATSTATRSTRRSSRSPASYLTRALVYFDNRGIDGLVNGLAAVVGGGSGRLRRAQTGFVRSYALSMLGGALLVVAACWSVSASGELRR